MEISIGSTYKLSDGRSVKVIQKNDKTNRAEVIIGKYNPFWVNYSNLKAI